MHPEPRKRRNMNNIKIRIDTKHYTLSIHRKALKAVGDPPFINFGYQPETMQLLIMATWLDDRKSVRSRINSGGSNSIYSKSLLQGIRQVSHILMDSGSYLVEGEAIDSQGLLIFPLKMAEKISKKVSS